MHNDSDSPTMIGIGSTKQGNHHLGCPHFWIHGIPVETPKLPKQNQPTNHELITANSRCFYLGARHVVLFWLLLCWLMWDRICLLLPFVDQPEKKTYQPKPKQPNQTNLPTKPQPTIPNDQQLSELTGPAACEPPWGLSKARLTGDVQGKGKIRNQIEE